MSAMKRIISLIVSVFLLLKLAAQQELHIHHININNGDATLIGIYDTELKKYTYKVLLDGGQSNANKYLLPYIKKMIGTDYEATHFNYVILSHYHDDHYMGLLALMDGRIRTDILIDPGGYVASRIFKNAPSAGVKPPKMGVSMDWLKAIDTAVDHNYILARSTIIKRYDLSPYTSIGKKINIGKIGETDVELQCIAGWGNTLDSGGHIKPNPNPNKESANNYTLAFILSCGEFRYFLGGDMGGSGDSYINQEVTVTNFLNEKYPESRSMDTINNYAGHLCGFKANHHGSDNSNTSAFMENMHPSIVITSGGDNSNWQIPRSNYLKRLAKVKPVSTLSILSDSTYNQGVYFTNLYNFNSGDTTLRTANTLFKNKPRISYSYGNDTPAHKYSYMIKIKSSDAIKEKSVFEVGLVDTSSTFPYKRLGYYFCHRK